MCPFFRLLIMAWSQYIVTSSIAMGWNHYMTIYMTVYLISTQGVKFSVDGAGYRGAVAAREYVVF